MFGSLTIVAWLVNAFLGFRMHGLRRMPKGVVLAHAIVLLVGLTTWIAYLATDRQAIGWIALAWLLVANGFGDAAVVRRWKKKSDGGKGLVGTYLDRIKRPILLTHAAGAGVTAGFALATLLTA